MPWPLPRRKQSERERVQQSLRQVRSLNSQPAGDVSIAFEVGMGRAWIVWARFAGGPLYLGVRHAHLAQDPQRPRRSPGLHDLHGQIADLAQITDLELVVIRYRPDLSKWGGSLSASDPASHRPHADRDCNAHGYRGLRQMRAWDGAVNEDRPSPASPHHDSDGWRSRVLLPPWSPPSSAPLPRPRGDDHGRAQREGRAEHVRRLHAPPASAWP